MVRLNRELSCRCRADSLPLDDIWNLVCSRSMLWSTDSSWSFPCTEDPTALRSVPCCTMRGIPRAFLMVKDAFSFTVKSGVEEVPSENACKQHSNDFSLYGLSSFTECWTTTTGWVLISKRTWWAGAHLGQFLKDTDAALGDGDVHGVFGADVDQHARFRNKCEVITMNRTFVYGSIVLHLHK